MLKLCPQCKVEKSVDDFYKRVHSPDGKDTYCKLCKLENVRRYREGNRQTIRDGQRRTYYAKESRRRQLKDSALRRAYCITIEDWDDMYTAQNGECNICERDDRSLVVDHDHNTGRVRGLLCQNCNRALGLMGDSVESLVNAIDHLNQIAV